MVSSKVKKKDIGDKSPKPTRRSKRARKPSARLSLPEEIPKEKLQTAPSQPYKDPAVIQSEKRVSGSKNVKKKRKTKKISYEIDCNNINVDISDFKKDLWNRAKNGKLNLAKNVRIKQKGNTILISSRSYFSKKSVRSNIHFLTTAYLKEQKIDRAVHLVGNGNTYKLMYK